jgi:hypothetical protein
MNNLEILLINYKYITYKCLRSKHSRYELMTKRPLSNKRCGLVECPLSFGLEYSWLWIYLEILRSRRRSGRCRRRRRCYCWED